MENYQDWDVDNQLSWYDEVYVEIENLVGDMVESFWEEKNKIQCCLNKVLLVSGNSCLSG